MRMEKFWFIELRKQKKPFHEDEHRKELLIAFSRQFQQFEEETYPLIQLNKVYDDLHNLVYSLQAKPDRQICLSFGLVSGKIGGENYRNFLFHIPLKINLQKQIITLEADTLAHVITCEQAFTELIDKHFPGESEEKSP